MTINYETLAGLHAWRESIEKSIPAYVRPAAYGVGVATIGPSGQVLDTRYPVVNTDAHLLGAALLSQQLGRTSGTASHRLEPAELEQAVAALAPAEACREVDHPNLNAWRTMLEVVAQPDPPGGQRVLVPSSIGRPDEIGILELSLEQPLDRRFRRGSLLPIRRGSAPAAMPENP